MFLSILLILEALAKVAMIVLNTLTAGSTPGSHQALYVLSPCDIVTLARLAGDGTSCAESFTSELYLYIIDWWGFCSNSGYAVE